MQIPEFQHSLYPPSIVVSFSKGSVSFDSRHFLSFRFPSSPPELKQRQARTLHSLVSPSPCQQPVMPSGPKKRKAAKKRKQQARILHSSPTLQAFGAVVSVHCAHIEKESANHKMEDVQGEEFRLSDEIVKGVGVHEPENNEYAKEIRIGGDDSGGNSSSEDSKPEEKSPEFVKEEKLEEKLEEVCEYVLQAVENPVENLVVPDVPEVVESEKIEEKLTLSPDDCNGTSPVVGEAVSNGTEETKLAAEEEKKEEATGVVDLVSKGNVDDLLQEAAEVVPAAGPKAIEPQIPESRAYEIAAVDTRTVGEQHDEPEIPESTGYQPPIITVTQATQRATSWRSCCGLLDVLRRSDR